MSRFHNVDVSRRLAAMNDAQTRAGIAQLAEIADSNRRTEREISRRNFEKRREPPASTAPGRGVGTVRRLTAPGVERVGSHVLRATGRQPEAGPPSPADFFAAQSGIRELLLNPEPLSAEGQVDNVLDTLGQSDDTQIADALQPHAKARARKAASDLAQISKMMGKPGVTQRQVMQAQAQFARAYPEFARRGMKPTPMTSEQAAALQSEIRLDEYNSAAQQLLNGEMPDRLLFQDEKGNVRVPDGLMDIARMQSQQIEMQRDVEFSRRKAIAERFEREMDMLHQAEPDRPDKNATPEEIAQYQREKQRINVRRRDLINTYYGPPGERDPARFEQRMQTAERAGMGVVNTDADFDDLAPGELYIDAETGAAAQKIDTTGMPTIDDMVAYDALPIGAQFIDGQTGELLVKGAQ